MFDIGFTELLVLATLGLLVLGPDRLPHAARLLGALIAWSKRTFADFKYDLTSEIQAKELQERLQQAASKNQNNAPEDAGDIERVKDTDNPTQNDKKKPNSKNP